MIKASDLRRGNFAVDYITQNPHQVSNIWIGKSGIRSSWDHAGETGNDYVFFTGMKDFNGREYGTTCNAKDVNPISITEEWLFRFGFTKEDVGENHVRYFKGEGLLFGVEFINHPNEQNQIIITPSHVWDASYTGSPCLYVHQLQNLYFALTGEELTTIK